MESYLGLQASAFNGQRAALFRVRTSAADVYMSASRSNYGNEERAVVEVDCARFLKLWRDEPRGAHAGLANGTPQTWRADPRFELAAEGFSFGEQDPVPLAEVSCPAGAAVPYVAFTDGVMRTLWLAAYAAKSFPVECGVTDAEALQRLAGTAGSRWFSVAELVPPQTA
ncbi:plasmid fertility inhibition factor family protein [Paraburkholderia silvatlantica]|uniref:plasmid fertility inhibition factor family protein n=1 Tax=Paraburkholderia silvatlantica TaxID=321895 RepID=UPI0037535A38